MTDLLTPTQRTTSTCSRPAPITERATVASPYFIACGARSGSTLLRWLIDSHPDVACPGETDIATLVNTYVQTATAMGGEHTGEGLSPLQRAREVADDLVATYLDVMGKTRWCDKSLSNALHLEQLAQTWPESRFILLHRHCMDFVMSGLEASVWGLDTYGFSPYAQMSPTSPVMALIGYWIERTAKMLAFEAQFPERCLRVRYEDLVTRTDEVVASVWEHFGVEPVAGVAESAFEGAHDPFAPADYKIWFTQAVHGDSIGRGARVPPERVAGPLRASVNELLHRLDYATVGDDWGSGGMATAVAAQAPLSFIELRVLDGHRTLMREFIDLSDRSTPGSARPNDPGGSAACVVVVEQAVLAGICAGSENFGGALRDRTVRYYGAFPQNFSSEKELLDRLTSLFAHRGDELLGRSAGSAAGAPTQVS
jgi:Sulfotransferase family